jgi:hypothetical protein
MGRFERTNVMRELTEARGAAFLLWHPRRGRWVFDVMLTALSRQFAAEGA